LAQKIHENSLSQNTLASLKNLVAAIETNDFA